MKLIIIICLLLFALGAVNCDTSTANPYKQKYEEQVAVNTKLQTTIGDLQQTITALGVRIDSIYTTSLKKIDSLKAVVVLKDSIINNNNQNVEIMLQSIQSGLENLSASALEYLISIQNR